MSTLALKVLLDRISAFDNKAVKAAVNYRQTHSLVLERASLADQFGESFQEAYKLSDEDRKEIEKMVISGWPKLVARAQAALTNKKDIEYIIEPGRIVAIFYGPKRNYNRIDDTFFKSDATYSELFTPLFASIKFFLIARAKRKILPRRDKKGNILTDEKGKPIEAMSISDMFNQGHFEGASIAYSIAAQFLPTAEDPTNYFENEDIRKVIRAASLEVGKDRIIEGELFLDLSSKFKNVKPTDNDFTKTVTVIIEAKGANQLRGAKEEARIRPEFVKHIESVLSGRTAIEWANQESSDSTIDVITKKLINEAIDAGAKGTKQRLSTNSNAVKKTVKTSKRIRENKVRVTGIPQKGVQEPKAPQATASYLSLITLINERLPPRVRANMGSPRLNNVTGRLSESAKVTNITQTAQGMPSIEYTYQRDPYDVFDKTRGREPWKTPARDPSTLIATSVRQIAQQLGLRRFYTRRAQ